MSEQLLVDGPPSPAPSAPSPSGTRRKGRGQGRQALKGAMFGVPFFIGFVCIFLIPIVYAITESLFTVKSSGLGFGGSTTVFVGMENFVRAIQDGKFWSSVIRVLVFALIQIPVTMIVALSMALLLDGVRRRTASRFRFAFLIPYMVPGIVGTLIWVYLYSPSVGPLTPFFKTFGIQVDFFSPQAIWLSIGNLLVWTVAGFNMLIIFGALQGVSRDMFDAARIDGASELRIAWSIKIPSIRGTLVLTTMLSIIGMLQIFNEPLLFRAVSPETVTKNFTPILYIYNIAFETNNYNYAAALSVVLAAVVGIVSFVFYRFTNRPQP